MLHQIPELRLIHTNFNEPQAATKVVLKEDEATRLGVSNMGVETTLAMRYGKGLPITNTWEGDYNIPVVLKSKKSDRSTPQDLANEQIPVQSWYKELISVLLVCWV